MFKKPYHSWLIPYLEATLDEHRRALLESRLAVDSKLAAELESLRRVTGHMGALSSQSPAEAPATTPDIWPKVRDRIEARGARRVSLGAPLVWGGGLAAASVLTVALVFGPLGHNNHREAAKPRVQQMASNQTANDGQMDTPNQPPRAIGTQSAPSGQTANNKQIASSSLPPEASTPIRNDGVAGPNSIPGPGSIPGTASLPPTPAAPDIDPSLVVVPAAPPLPKQPAPTKSMPFQTAHKVQSPLNIPQPAKATQSAEANSARTPSVSAAKPLGTADGKGIRIADSSAAKSTTGRMPPSAATASSARPPANTASSARPPAVPSQNLVVAEKSTPRDALPTLPVPAKILAAPRTSMQFQAAAPLSPGGNLSGVAGLASPQIASAKDTPSAADSAVNGVNSPVVSATPMAKSARAPTPSEPIHSESMQAAHSANIAARRGKVSEDKDQNEARIASKPTPPDIASWVAVLERTLSAPSYGTPGSQDETMHILNVARSSGHLPALRRTLALRQVDADSPALRKAGPNLPALRALATIDSFAVDQEAAGNVDKDTLAVDKETAVKSWRKITNSVYAVGEDWFQLAQAEERAGNHAAAHHAYQRALVGLPKDSPHWAAAKRHSH